MTDNTPPSPAELGLLRVEAARYALLRRLASAMRHQLVMHLQPIGMVAEVVGRRLRADQPDLAQVHDGVTRINGLSKVAVQACLDLVTWLGPEPGVQVPLHVAVEDCVDLLRGNLSFRGFSLRSEVGEQATAVPRASVRMLLPGALLALTDTAPAPAEIVLSAAADADAVRLAIRMQRVEGTNEFPGQLPYRELNWREVEAMARAEDVALQHGPDSVELAFPILE